MTRSRWGVVLGGLGLVTAAVACLNPQPLPPSEGTAEADDAGAGTSFGGADGGSASTNGDAATSVPPAADGGDAGHAGDAGDAGPDGGDGGED